MQSGYVFSGILPYCTYSCLLVKVADLATAGIVLSEDSLRAYFKCSQYYHYGGIQETPVLMTVIKTTIELMMAEAVEKEIDSPSTSFLPYLQKAIGRLNLRRLYLEGEIFDLSNKAIFALTEFFSLVSPAKYLPFTGPTLHRVLISKTPIDLRVSSTMIRKGTQELIGIYFSPYVLNHHTQNDPIPYLHLRLLEKFGTDHFKRNTASLFVFGVDKNGGLTTQVLGSKDFKEDSYVLLQGVVRAIEMGIHFPLNPCQHYCEFKEKCFPYKKVCP
jgi:hypothetical protein